MNTSNTANAETGVATKLWIAGVSVPVTVLWVTESHAEIVTPGGLDLASNQLTALIMRDFLSMPMRVVAQTDQNAVLHFVQRPHPSVLELIDRDLIKAGIGRLRDMLEERAVPDNAHADLESWQARADRDDSAAHIQFRERVNSLRAYRVSEPLSAAFA
ncbi:hypothetical protein FGU71_10285 [Erythrobacter insulae]|uniref:Uncharacterized protein n=1 Tax=Erythrobacter insulae TaxID=2584124 RepID=A0A547PDK3_9SPHN|nr:hypothetical protein [Erythrobacter insulae]TRD12210.1 hypothetical protein FGU71_10285 [Erythrobacter insulae]